MLKLYGQIAERPQHMLLRVACGIHSNDVEAAIETYNLMSERWATHATPTLFNAGTPRPQLSSCFLLTLKEDSIDGIYDTLKTCAQISKTSGGIGLALHTLRATGSYIKGTNGTSNGLVPMLRVFNATARFVDQGGGKRRGSIAAYLEPWHADVYEFLDMKKNQGDDQRRARDLFYALWVCDLFMKRVEANELWTLMCPNECPGLSEVWGDEFERLYTRYEQQGKGRTVVKARKLWQAILDSQQETGTPFMVYKDTANRKSNQQNLGTLKSSNLCTEILEYTAPDEVAVCNLASISLPRFLVDKYDPTTRKMEQVFDFKRLIEVTKILTKNLNRIIDINYYPVPEAEKSNFQHRPIGLGVQGMADLFAALRLPYESEGAQQLNREIFATIYYGACVASCEMAKIQTPYPSYAGSPASKGLLQYDLWGVTEPETVGGLLDWAKVKADIAQYGMRNSLLVAPMPTASTSQILGNNESFEPYTSNLYTRRTLAGDFICATKRLLKDLVERGLWNENLKQKLMAANGSVQNIAEVPDDLKKLYKTVWEMNGKTLINMAAARGAYICQSQSFNVHMSDATSQKLTAMHFYGWRSGLKTGMYYLRTRAATDAVKFTVDPEIVKQMAAAAAAANANNASANNISTPLPPTQLTATASTLLQQNVEGLEPLAMNAPPSLTTTGARRSHNANNNAAPVIAGAPTGGLLPPDLTAPGSHGRSVLQTRYIVQAKAPMSKDQRENEEQQTIERWRKERDQRKKEQDDDESGGCTMCSG